MKHFLIYPIFCSLLLLIAFGCGDEGITATSTSTADLPLLSPANGPSSPGPFIIRSESGFGCFYTDPQAGMTAVIGFDLVDLCTNGPPPIHDIVEFQSINVPADEDRFIYIAGGTDVTASVWPSSIGPYLLNQDCGFLGTIDPLATGTVEFTWTDNDNNPAASDGRNANSYGLSIKHSEMNRADGSIVKFQGHFRLVWDGDSQGFVYETKINLTD